ncbi:hypothetical protein Syun_007588 [Stephania yunnanensis]|uniref:RING-type domain-containing protein n=1 Tax=Stephania yunnanensis TaxID=152371 RepID=A0AAP0KYP3_9MAGN
MAMANKKDEEGSSPSNDFDPCPICLGPFRDDAYLDRCFHKFCYSCIVSWSKFVANQHSQRQLSLKCPLCKTDNFSVVYGCNGDSFERYYLNQESSEKNFFSRDHKYRLRCYYREPGAIYEKFNIQQYWRFSRYLQPNKWLHLWLRREIQALIQEEDVEIIVHHILGVIESFAKMNETGRSKGTPETKREEFKKLVSDAARPFLVGRADRFASEIELFLSSGMNIEAYDKVYLQSLGISSGDGAESNIQDQTPAVPYLHFFDNDSDTD